MSFALRVLLLCLLLSDSLARRVTADLLPGNVSVQNWQTENGLPQNSVHALLQARNGYLWIGTEGGLARFDGLRFTVFDAQNTPELRSSFVRAIVEDSVQALWIATAAGLTRYAGAHFTSFTTQQGLPGNDVLALYPDVNGQLWAVTTEGPAHFQGGRFIGHRWSGFSGQMLTASGLDQQGVIWLGVGSTLLQLRPDGSVVQKGSLPSRTGNIQAVLGDPSGKLWLGTSEGLAVFEKNTIRSVPLPSTMPSKRITALCRTSDGTLLIGTERGAAQWTGSSASRLPLSDPAANDAVLSMVQDREGNLWIGTDSDGLTIIRDRKFKTYGGGTTPAENLFRCVFQDGQGRILAGTNGHGLRVLTNGQSVSLSTSNGLSSDVILSLGQNSKGEGLVGTPDGLNVLHPGGVTVLTSADGLPDDFIQSIYKDHDESVWIGTRRGLSHWSGDTLITSTERDGLPSEFIGSILRRRNGELWIGTLRGLAAMNGSGSPARFTARGLPGQIVTTLHEDESGVLWIGTEDDGLVRMGQGDQKPFHFPSTLGLPASVLEILEDSHQRFWILSPRGLYVVPKADLSAYATTGDQRAISIVSYGTADGLRVNPFTGTGHPTGWRDKDNGLWFATAGGLISVDAKHVEPRKEPPLIAMASVTLNDRELPLQEHRPLEIPPGVSRIAFEYDGLSFVAPQRVTFKYRLKGFDRDWIEAGTRRTAYYTNLPSGSYQFEALARNLDGVWSMDPALIRFHVQPHFYQRWWFFLLLLIGVSGMAYAGYRWRVQLVRAQFSAVLAERTRIAREIHDTLAQNLVAVSLQLEIVQRLMAHSAEAAQQTLQQTSHLVQDSIAEARRSIWNLRSAEPDSDDLPSRLSKMLASVTSNSRLAVSFQVTGTYRPLPAATENELLRIASEAVTNAVRHANASKVTVTLAFDGLRAALTVEDDGAGFEARPGAQSASGHYGLQGMSERAKNINANLSVDSHAGQGTRVKVELPVS